MRVLIALFFAVGFLLAQFSSPEELGYAIDSASDQTHVMAGVPPALLVWNVLATPLTWFLVKWRAPSEPDGVPSWRRRLAAFVIDFVVIFCAIVPVATLIPLVAEAARTGTFAWTFTRDFSVWSDWLIGFLLGNGVFAGMLLYFAVPIVRGTQTVGCYLLRLKVVPVEGRQLRLSSAVWRVILGYIALCMAPVTVWRGHGLDGSTWYDRSTRFRVNLVKSRTAV